MGCGLFSWKFVMVFLLILRLVFNFILDVYFLFFNICFFFFWFIFFLFFLVFKVFFRFFTICFREELELFSF